MKTVGKPVPRRVAFLIHGGKPPRGGEWGTVALIHRLDRTLFAPYVFYGHENAAVADLLQTGVPAFPIPTSPFFTDLYLRNASLANPALHLRIVWNLVKSRVIQSLVRMIEAHRIDFLYCGDNFSKVIGGVAARLTRRRIIGTCHDTLDRGLLGGVLKTLNLLALDRVIAVSETVRGSFPMHGPMSGKVVTIANGVDIQRFDPAHARSTIRAELNIAPATAVIGSIGMMDKNKGQAGLLRAFHDLTRRWAEPVHLIFVGDGPEKARLEQLTHEWDVERSVHFVGYRRDIPAILKGMDIIVVPTLEYESFSLATVEAMAMQVPVVASRLGGLAEVVEDGKTGLLFPPGDHAQLLAALRSLLADSALRARMGQAGRQRVRERYLATVRDQHIQREFLSLCAERGRPMEMNPHAH